MTSKPGFFRLDLTFYLEEYEVKYLAKSIFYLCKYYKNIQELYTVHENGKVEAKNKANKKNKQPLL